MNQLLPEHHRGMRLTLQGGAGVSFFFILSGFVLAWSARPGTSPGLFYRRRASRILPAYVVACVLAGVVVLLEGWDVALRLTDAIPSLFLTQAWSTDPAVFFGGNGVAWSLSVEALFYLLFPGLILLARRLSVRGQLAALVGVVVLKVLWDGILWWSAIPNWGWMVNIFPVGRVPEFAIGVLLALLVQAGRLRRVRLYWALPLAVLAYVGAGFMPDQLRSCMLTLVPFALLIAGAANSDLRGGRSVLRARWLVKLGEWSFAFYLVHQLIIRCLSVFVLDGRPTGGAPVVLVSLLLSLGLAMALYCIVERPLDSRLRGAAPSPRGASPLAAAANGHGDGHHDHRQAAMAGVAAGADLWPGHAGPDADEWMNSDDTAELRLHGMPTLPPVPADFSNRRFSGALSESQFC